LREQGGRMGGKEEIEKKGGRGWEGKGRMISGTWGDRRPYDSHAGVEKMVFKVLVFTGFKKTNKKSRKVGFFVF